MKRSFVSRYARYVCFLLSAIVFMYAGVGLVGLYVGEYTTEQTFASLAKRVASAEATAEANATADAAEIAPIQTAETPWATAASSLAEVEQPEELTTDSASAPIATEVIANTLAAANVTARNGASPEPIATNAVATVNPTATAKPAATVAPVKSGVIAMLQGLYAENADLGGWITIPDTVIDYPVMYTPRDPEKYIRLSFEGDVSSSGVPFIGKGCKISPQSDNIIIYGHNMRKGTMFASLLNYRSTSYYQQHPTIRFSTLYNSASYDIIAAFQTDIYDADTLRCYKFINAQSEDDFNSFVSAVKKASMYNTGVTAAYGDKLLTLSTCSYHTTDGRFVVIARKRQ